MKKKQTKTAYRVRNWKEYNNALKQRGSLTVWISDDVIQAWRAMARTGKKGKPQTYSDLAILAMLTLQEIYHLPLRGTCGFTESIFTLLNLTLPVPGFS